MATTTEHAQPTVLIVGAGLGGIMLGALLEKAGIPYTIFERAATVKPLGSALSIGANLLTAFEQLSLLDKFVAMGRRLEYAQIVRESSFEVLTTLGFEKWEELSGYAGYIVSRPFLYDLLLKQIPVHKIHFNKRVLAISEKEDKVIIQTSDNCVYTGDILVGADGAYSTVRQQLYERLKAEGTLPKSDQEDLPFSCTCLVGQTEELDPQDFPQINDPIAQYTTLANDKPYTWVLFNTAQKTISWMVLYHLEKITNKAEQEQDNDNSEWGPHAAQSMCDETRDFPIPFGTGKTLGDIYDRTPKELISKVMLEEKIFTTWHSGRTVLLGDGAMTAMHDAIALANLIYALPSNTSKDIQEMFSEYKAERLPPVIEAHKSSVTLAKVMDKGWGGTIALWISGHLPQWLWTVFWGKSFKDRPQIGYLRQVENKGTVVPNVSPSTEKARALYEKRQGVVSI
ncbi:hypothetical protein BGX29_004399 [Mortierella sp. GBA35]|nr:hypothetical protein BGX29_004399 [Mortierella sp. GBA35]KAG0209568.1 hypothetical protein BGX33_005463 [Mortierella sp. NVP41]